MGLDTTLAILLAVINNMTDRDMVFGLIVFGSMAVALWRIVRNERNPVKLWHFVASRHDGQQWGDIDKLGKSVAVVLSVWVVVKLTSMVKEVSVLELVAALSVVLGFLGGVATFSAWFRSRQRRGLLSEEDVVTKDKEPK